MRDLKRSASVVVCRLSLLALVAAVWLSGMGKSRPQRAIVCRRGYSRMEEQVQLRPGRATELELPAGVIVSSVAVQVGGRRVDKLVFREILGPLPKVGKGANRDVPKRPVIGHVLTIPEQIVKTAVLQYDIGGINWTPKLWLALTNDNRLSVVFQAAVRNEAVALEGCEVTLESWFEPLPEDEDVSVWERAEAPRSHPDEDALGTGLTYSLGRISLAMDSTTLTVIGQAEAKFAPRSVWDTRSAGRPGAFLLFHNPFAFAICSTDLRLHRGLTTLGCHEVGYSAPGGTMVARAGTSLQLPVKMSVRTTERAEEEEGPRFNHAVTLEVTNKSGEAAQVEVVYGKKAGSEHKTQYHFAKEPTRRPGDVFIWELTLESGKTERIVLDFDSDSLTYREYQHYGLADFRR